MGLKINKRSLKNKDDLYHCLPTVITTTKAVTLNTVFKDRTPTKSTRTSEQTHIGIVLWKPLCNSVLLNIAPSSNLSFWFLMRTQHGCCSVLEGCAASIYGRWRAMETTARNAKEVKRLQYFPPFSVFLQCRVSIIPSCRIHQPSSPFLNFKMVADFF